VDDQRGDGGDWVSWVAPLVLCALMVVVAFVVVAVFVAAGGSLSQLWSPWWMPVGCAALVAAAFVVSCRRSWSWVLVVTVMAVTLSGSSDDFRTDPQWVSRMSVTMVTLAVWSAALLWTRRHPAR
jgi:hypothetical protein